MVMHAVRVTEHAKGCAQHGSEAERRPLVGLGRVGAEKYQHSKYPVCGVSAGVGNLLSAVSAWEVMLLVGVVLRARGNHGGNQRQRGRLTMHALVLI